METENYEDFEDDGIEIKHAVVPDVIRPNPQAGSDDPVLWVVYTRSERQEVEGRTAAVALAKEWTAEDGVTAMVESEDGRVKMQFKSGSLVDYVLETRKGRKA